jgi:hypothetical protein
MMTGNEVSRRLKAWAKGRPIPRGATLRLKASDEPDALIAAFAKMGGESAPWGIAFGYPGKPQILTVPEPRDRDLVAEMAAATARLFLEHFRHPDFDDESPSDWRQITTLRQLWLPNPSHLDMLHFLNYTYTFTKYGDSDRAILLNKLGRLMGWLFREAQRPGQVTVMVATEALREAYSFPAEDIRQAHLGFLLAWLQTPGNRDARLRAAQGAETLSIATSLDPASERDRLAELVERWDNARSNANDRAMSSEANRINEILSQELLRRFELVDRTIAVLKSDKRRVNRGLGELAKASNQELWYQYLRMERNSDDGDDGPAFITSPETDRYPAAAGSRYFVHEASEELRLAVLIHDDPELQDEAIAQGDAIRGEIIAVKDEDPGRRTVPVWTIDAPDVAPVRIREGSWLCVAGLPQRIVTVRSIEPTGKGSLKIEIEVIYLKTKPRDGRRDVLAADDRRLVGMTVTLVPASTEGMLRRKSQKIWVKETPGAWLTHSKPSQPLEEDVTAEDDGNLDSLA